MNSGGIDRRTILGQAVGTGAAISLAGLAQAAPAATTSTANTGADGSANKKIRVGVIGCGSVSHRYLPHLAECPYVELVSTCDILDAGKKKGVGVWGAPVVVTSHRVLIWGAGARQNG